MKSEQCLVTAIFLSMASVSAAAPRTWCNPLSLPDLPLGYLCRDNKNGDPFPPGHSWRLRFWVSNTAGLKDIRQFREVADPAMLVDGDTWYLYPSCGLLWESNDCGGTWRRHHVVEKGWYAPGVAKFRGRYYLVESGGQPLKVADSPTGPFKELGNFKWETFGSDPDMPQPQDPSLMADGDRLYLYWGCGSYPKSVWGAELDPEDPTKCRGESRCLVYWDPKTFGFQDDFIEGAWAFRRGDDYYIVYSTFMIVGHMYCMNAAKGKSPLGPFIHQKQNPFLQTPLGLVTGTGHGCVWEDKRGDFWVSYGVEVNAYNGCERLIGQDRLAFDANGDIVCGSASQTPQWLPSSGKKGDTGWKAIPLETEATQATDDFLQTWWTPPALPTSIEFAFRRPSTIESCRVIWKDIGLDTLRGVMPGPVRYCIDRRTDGKWFPWIDRSANDLDLMVDYREGEECVADAVRLTILDAPKGITPALVELTVFGQELKARSALEQQIAKGHRILVSDAWGGGHRIIFDFNGRRGWIVEPNEGVPIAKGNPWIWTMQWMGAYLERTGAPLLVEKGFRHVHLEAHDDRADETGLKAFAEFQDYLVRELGFAPRANLIGMSWGGFYSVRYAVRYPQNVSKVFLDGPLMSFEGFRFDIGPWKDSAPADGRWAADPRMPVNMAKQYAGLKIPTYLLYGGEDTINVPKANCEPFIERVKRAGGEIVVEKRNLYGHHPHGFEHGDIGKIVEFFLGTD